MNLYEDHDVLDPLIFSGDDYAVKASIVQGNLAYTIKLNEGSAGFLPVRMYEWVLGDSKNDKLRDEAQKAIDRFAEDDVQSWNEETVLPSARLQKKVFLIQRLLENILKNERMTQELNRLCPDNSKNKVD